MSGQPLLGEAELSELHAAVEAALAARSEEGLAVAGWGEISLGVGWPGGSPRVVAKRMPRFASRETFDVYADTVARYIERLGERGVEAVASELQAVEVEGGVIPYCLQPLLDSATLAPRLLAAGDPQAGHPLIGEVAAAVERVVDERTGLDAQLSNWVWQDGRLIYLDVTTPFLRDERGRDQMDFDALVSAYPAIVRGALRRWVAPGIIARYHDRRLVLTDICSNLYKERLEAWMPACMEAANARLESPLEPDEIRRDYRSDARTWRWVQRIRRTDRAWHRLRGRTYPYLLPGRIER